MFIRAIVTAGAKREVIRKIMDSVLEISVRQKAERNMANNRVLELVARHFHVPIKSVHLVSGHRNQNKIVEIVTLR